MKHVFSISCAAFLSLVLLATGCKKGDEGPAGPAGPAGPNGPQGPKGDTGVANVIYSPWFDVTYTAQTNQAGDTVFFYFSNVNIPKLTNAILNTGEAKMFINWGTDATPEIDPLPLLDPIFGISITTTFSAGKVLLLGNDDWGTFTSTQDNLKHNRYRYILIPGGVPARWAIDWNNYESVKKLFNLPD
jgi:hypothetical protein